MYQLIINIRWIHNLRNKDVIQIVDIKFQIINIFSWGTSCNSIVGHGQSIYW